MRTTVEGEKFKVKRERAEPTLEAWGLAFHFPLSTFHSAEGGPQ
jgi:hypothetical protein